MISEKAYVYNAHQVLLLLTLPSKNNPIVMFCSHVAKIAYV